MAKRAYIYENTACAVTGSWHSGGGMLVVTAGDPDEAWRATEEYARVLKNDPEDTGAIGEPDYVYDVADDATERVVIFPDQGCC